MKCAASALGRIRLRLLRPNLHYSGMNRCRGAQDVRERPPGKFVEPSGLVGRTGSHPPLSAKKNRPKGGFLFGGEGGIRTLGTAINRTHAFQASPFNHSGTSPKPDLHLLEGRQF